MNLESFIKKLTESTSIGDDAIEDFILKNKALLKQKQIKIVKNGPDKWTTTFLKANKSVTNDAEKTLKGLVYLSTEK